MLKMTFQRNDFREIEPGDIAFLYQVSLGIVTDVMINSTLEHYQVSPPLYFKRWNYSLAGIFFLFQFYALHESLSNLCTQDFCLICNKITVLRKLSDSYWSDSYPVSVREYVNLYSYSWVPWNQCVKHCNFTCALAIWHIYTFEQTYSGSPSKG